MVLDGIQVADESLIRHLSCQGTCNTLIWTSSWRSPIRPIGWSCILTVFSIGSSSKEVLKPSFSLRYSNAVAEVRLRWEHKILATAVLSTKNPKLAGAGNSTRDSTIFLVNPRFNQDKWFSSVVNFQKHVDFLKSGETQKWRKTDATNVFFRRKKKRNLTETN